MYTKTHCIYISLCIYTSNSVKDIWPVGSWTGNKDRIIDVDNSIDKINKLFIKCKKYFTSEE